MTKLFLQNFFEFLFDFITKKGNTFLFERLSREDYLKINTTHKVKQFVEKVNLEDKLLTLSKLGIRTALIIWDEQNQKTKKVEDVLVAYIDVPAHELSKQIIKDKIFGMMDIDLIKSAQYVSKVSNSKNYILNRKYLNVKHNQMVKTRLLAQKLEAEDNFDWYVDTIQFALGLEPMLEGFGIDLDQFKILLYLHNCPNGATIEHLRSKVQKPTYTTRLLGKMRELNMIQYDPRNKEVTMIATNGIVVLHQIISKFP